MFVEYDENVDPLIEWCRIGGCALDLRMDPGLLFYTWRVHRLHGDCDCKRIVFGWVRGRGKVLCGRDRLGRCMGFDRDGTLLVDSVGSVTCIFWFYTWRAACSQIVVGF